MLKQFLNWRKSDSGVVALEFALVSLPFIMVVIGIIELAFMFAASSVLEGATHAAARTIRTGQVQNSTDPVATFQQAMCDNVGGIITCNDVVYEVITVPDGNFASAGGASYDSDGNMVSRGFDPGGDSDVVVVRSSYIYNFATPFLGRLLSSRGDNTVLIMSTVTVRNEPYDF